MEAVSCFICATDYASDDEIGSTVCGHVYHLKCLQLWLKNSPTCPDCRKKNPTVMKIHLNFQDMNKSKLKSPKEQVPIKVSEPLPRKDDNDFLFNLQLQEEYARSLKA